MNKVQVKKFITRQTSVIGPIGMKLHGSIIPIPGNCIYFQLIFYLTSRIIYQLDFCMRPVRHYPSGNQGVSIFNIKVFCMKIVDTAGAAKEITQRAPYFICPSKPIFYNTFLRSPNEIGVSKLKRIY